MFCPKCGSQIPDGSTSCSNCGAAVTPSAPAERPQPQPAPVSPVYAPPQAPAPAPKKKRGCLIAAIVVAAIVVFIVILALAFGGGDDPKPADSGNASISQSESQSTTPSVPEKVLYDKDGIKITFKSLDTTGLMGPNVKLLIENNTSSSYTVQVRDFSANGFMVDTVFSPEIDAGKKINDGITILSSSLKENGITNIEDISFSFHIFATDTWDTKDDSGKIDISFK